MLRKYINSKVELIRFDEQITGLNFSNVFFIQSEIIDKGILYEYCLPDEICDLIPFTSNSVVNAVKNDDKTVDEYRELVLNNDPFNKYSGQTLGYIFDCKDINWVKNYVSKSTNSFMKDRVKYLAEFYKML